MDLEKKRLEWIKKRDRVYTYGHDLLDTVEIDSEWSWIEQLIQQVREDERKKVIEKLLSESICDECEWPLSLCSLKAIKRDGNKEHFDNFIDASFNP